MPDDSVPPHPRVKVPAIVAIVLKQLVVLRDREQISPETYQCQIDRLTNEELRPRGLSLLVRELSTGTTRFLVKEPRGTVCEMLDCHRDGAAGADGQARSDGQASPAPSVEAQG